MWTRFILYDRGHNFLRHCLLYIRCNKMLIRRATGQSFVSRLPSNPFLSCIFISRLISIRPHMGIWPRWGAWYITFDVSHNPKQAFVYILMFFAIDASPRNIDSLWWSDIIPHRLSRHHWFKLQIIVCINWAIKGINFIWIKLYIE